MLCYVKCKRLIRKFLATNQTESKEAKQEGFYASCWIYTKFKWSMKFKEILSQIKLG